MLNKLKSIFSKKNNVVSIKTDNSLNTSLSNLENISKFAVKEDSFKEDSFKEYSFKEVVPLDRPVVIDGEVLKIRLSEKIAKFEVAITEATNIINTEYKSCLQGTPKAEKKRALQQELHDIRVKKLWLSRLYDSISNDNRYSLTIQEAILLDFVEE